MTRDAEGDVPRDGGRRCERPVETVIVEDLIPYVESTFNVTGTCAGRAIDGFSMGGFGAAHLRFRYPHLFCAISIVGAALHRPGFFREERADIFEETFGNDEDYCRQESPWMLVRERAEKLKDKMIRLHVGENDDRLRAKNIDFHDLLDSLGLVHDFSVVPNAGHNGGHVLDNLDKPWVLGRPLGHRIAKARKDERGVTHRTLERGERNREE